MRWRKSKDRPPTPKMKIYLFEGIHTQKDAFSIWTGFVSSKVILIA